MNFWSKLGARIGAILGFGNTEPGSHSGGDFRTENENAPIEDNGLPSGWHFVGYVDQDGNTIHIGDEITDQQVRDCDRIFIAKTFPDGTTRYRQFSSARSKDAISDMLIRESGEGSPI